ncbi:ATP-dependent DNA helicase [Brevibacterium litoralis]|uniref:ATP-dependent DNA helicase n=1 Tax=Brevibacterium litoralis TaxID=3138935 RepID=UPI0032EEECD7
MSPTEQLLAGAVAALGGSPREGQQRMAEAVTSALDSRTHLLVQAGTGTGKSLAYLVPAVEHSVRTGNRVVVSTATLALQAQIVDRDLPRLVKAVGAELPRKPKAAVLKGRRNYLCKYKMDGGYPDEGAGMLFDLGADTAGDRVGGGGAGRGPDSPAAMTRLEEEIRRIRSWDASTETGDRDDLTPGVSDRAWSQVSVNAFDCLGQKCPLVEECWSELARARAAEADVVVTNHALLAIDAFGENSVLPEHSAVVVDEAHELRDRVTNALSGAITVAMLEAAASSARKHTTVQDTVVGMLDTAASALGKALANAEDGLITHWPDDLADAVVAIRDAAKQIFADSGADQDSKAPDAGRQMARARLQEILDLADRITERAGNDVSWVSRSNFRDRETVSLVVAPLSVAGTMRSGIFEEATVVATSATLALGGSFEPVAASMGLAGPEAPRYDSIDVGSPFAYEKQGILYVASHLRRPGRSGLGDDALDELQELLEASAGGALGLFSSRAGAQRAAEEMRERTDLPILLQGEDTLGSLVSQFAADDRTCLFGTMSLWQGVDVPGRTSRLVVIDRIPFPRPDDPLVTARTHQAHKNGANGFISVSATHAALRLAQGAGRLIRSVDDRGVVAVLDSRMRTAGYAGFLLRSLPPMWLTENGGAVRQALGRLAEG